MVANQDTCFFLTFLDCYMDTLWPHSNCWKLVGYALKTFRIRLDSIRVTWGPDSFLGQLDPEYVSKWTRKGSKWCRIRVLIRRHEYIAILSNIAIYFCRYIVDEKKQYRPSLCASDYENTNKTPANLNIGEKIWIILMVLCNSVYFCFVTQQIP